jgi:hypothetical protein
MRPSPIVILLLGALACWSGESVDAGVGPRIPGQPGTGGDGETDSAFVFTTLPTGTTDGLRGVWGPSPGIAFAVGENGRVLRWNDTSWTLLDTVRTLTTNTLESVWGPSATRLFVVGANGAALRLTAAGWTRDSTPTRNTLFGVWGASASEVWAVGANGTILRWNDTVWTSVASGTTDALRAISGASADSVWAVGDRGRVLRFDGLDWIEEPSGLPIQSSFTSVHALGGDTVIAAADDGTLRIRDELGWTPLTPTSNVVFNDVWARSSREAWAAAIANGVYRWNGDTIAAPPGAPQRTFQSLWGLSANEIMAVGPNGDAVIVRREAAP